MTALRRLTEAQYNALKNEVDSENGAGYALYVKLSRQSNEMGTATPLTQTLRSNLEASHNNHLAFDQTVPSYSTYSAAFDQYEATLTPPTPTPARNPRVRRPAATPPAPAGAGSADPLGVDSLDAPIAPVTPGRSAARFAPPAAPEGEPTIADVFTFFGGLVPTVDNHADMLDNHENRISDLEARPAGAGFGFSAPVGFIAGAIAALLAWLVLALLVHVVGTTLVVLIGLAFVAFFLVGGFAAAGVSVPRATRRA